MIHKEKNGIHWLQFEHLSQAPGLVHGIFLRHGGASSSPYRSLNVSTDIGDHASSVQTNLDQISTLLELPNLYWAKQVHDRVITTISEDSPQESTEPDALITNETDRALLIKHADCQAAIFYDPRHRVIANVHSGWKGSVLNIYAHVVEQLQKEHQSRPEELLVGISPSLGPDHAEFKNYRRELPEEFWQHQTKPNYFDFWAISEEQLIEVGVAAANIEIARLCTYSNPEDYYSYRRDSICGRHGTVVMLQSGER